MEKYVPIILTLINGIFSSIGNKTTLPVEPIAGFEGISLIIALFASVVGTTLGLLKLRPTRRALFLLIAGLLLVPALLKYMSIIALGGATGLEQLFALFLYFYIFLAVFYALTNFEYWLATIILKDKTGKP